MKQASTNLFIDDLGAFERTYKQAWYRIFGRILFIFGIITFIPTLFVLLLTPHQNLATMLMSNNLFGVALLLAIFSGPYVVIGLYIILKRGWKVIVPTRVDIYEGGLIFKTYRKLQKVRWEQVAATRQGVTTTIVKSYRGDESSSKQGYYYLELESGKKVELFSLDESDELWNTVLEHVEPLLKSRFEQELLAGQKISFGDDLSVDLTGLCFNGREFKWNKIESVDFENGRLLLINKDHTRDNLNVLRVPNIMIFYDLSNDQLQKRKTAIKG